MWNDYWDEKEEKTNVKVEYESTPIRQIAVQCPACKGWFSGYDIITSDFHYEHDILYSHCECPKCEHRFAIGEDSEIDSDVNFSEFNKQILRKKVTWE